MFNTTWPDGEFGQVTVMAKRGNSTSNLTPLLTGTLHMAGGAAVECRQFRSTIWSNFDQFEELTLRCTTAIDVPAVRGVDIISATGKADQTRVPAP